MLGQKPSWHWEISIGFSAALWFIVCFKSALRLHYIPLCLLENHYGAIKSNVVSQTNMEFSSVSDGCTLPLCLLWFVHLWWSRDTAVGKTLNRWQLRGDASSFFWMLSDTRARDFLNCWCATDSFEATWVWNVQWQNSSCPQNEEKLKCPYDMKCAI